MSIKIAVAGSGRMGSTVAALLADAEAVELAGMWGRGDALVDIINAADVVIDFSLPAGTEELLQALALNPRPLVCGVSGLSAAQTQALQDLSEHVPLVYDRNMSLGIAIMQRCVSETAKLLGEEFKVRIAETHHVHKKDSPSGTALKLAETVAASRGLSNIDAIEFEVERSGEVPGDHEVLLQSSFESLGFAHSVKTRDVFAEGAIRAARWIHSQPAGLYSMQDVLFS